MTKTKVEKKKYLQDLPAPKTKPQLSIFDIPESIIPLDKRLYYPDWTNRPPAQRNIITVDGKRVLTTGNLLAIVSRPGTGKSSVCEAIIASRINKKCDSLGFSVSLPSGRSKILFIDTERTIHDSWNSWERTYRRAGIKAPEIDKHIIFANFKAVSITERKRYVEDILNKNSDIGLVIFDGAGDFLRDTNSIPESSEFMDWINTFNFNISIIATIHSNPNDNKPRGTIGSELCRRAESVFLLRKLPDGIREVTTDFEHGKVRNDDDRISSYYKYSDELEMMISTEYTPKKIIDQEKTEEYKAMAQKIFEGKTTMSFTAVITKIMKLTEKGPEAAKQFFYRKLQFKNITKTDKGWVFSEGTI